MLLALGLCLLAPLPGAALGSDHQFPRFVADSWSEPQGLPQHFVDAILQTRDGYLWVGTRGGLGRFDGSRFAVFDEPGLAALRESEVWALSEDPDGSLWIGIYDGGLLRLKGSQLQRFGVEQGLPTDAVTSLAQGSDGSLWIGTARGLARKRGDRLTAVSDGALSVASIQALHVDGDGIVWVGTSTGLFSITNERVTNHSARHPESLSGPVAAIAGDARELWVGMSTRSEGFGLRRYAGDRVTVFMQGEGLPSNAVTSLASDRGTLWVGTLGGLCRVRNGRIERHRIPTRVLGGAQTYPFLDVQSLRLDRDGLLWIGTRADGLVRLRSVPFTASTAPELQGIIESVSGADGSIWYGTGSSIRHERDGVFTSYALPPGIMSGGIVTDPMGRVFIASSRGLYELKSGHLQPISLPPLRDQAVSSLFAARDGSLWIGARNAGAFRYDGGRLEPHTSAEGLLGQQVRGIAEDSHGAVWIATRDGGVTRLTAAGARHFGPAQGLASPIAQAIMVDSQDDVWVATREGLCRISDDRIATVTVSHGLPTNYNYQLAEDAAGRLWMTHARGISQVSLAQLRDVADGRAARLIVQSYGLGDGLPTTAMTVSVQPTIWKAPDGRLLFATERGVAVVDPATMSAPRPVPPVYVEALLVDARHYPLDGSALAPAGAGNVEIRYAAVDLLAPDNARFEYRLARGGAGADWIDLGAQRSVLLAELPPAQYRFEVRACTSGRVCSAAPAVVRFVLQPHLHQTRWFRAAVVVLFMAALLGGYRARERSRAARRRRESEIERHYRDELEAMVWLRTHELEAARDELVRRERLSVLGQLTATVSHELRNPLGTVRNSVFSIREGVEQHQPERVARAIGLAERNIRRCDAIIAQLLDFSRRPQLHMEETALDEWLAALLDEQAWPAGISVTRELHSGSRVRVDHERLRRALVNVLTNAVQAIEVGRGSDKQIRVCTGRVDSRVEILVSDSGPGIPEEVRERVFEPLFSTKSFGVGLGLPIVKAILEDHGGGVRIEPSAAPGATVTLWLPAL